MGLFKRKGERNRLEIESHKANEEQLRSQIAKVNGQIEVEESALQLAVTELEDWISRRAGDPDLETDEKILVPHLSSVCGREMNILKFKALADSFRKYQLPVAVGGAREKLVHVDTDIMHANLHVSNLTEKEAELTDQLSRNVSGERTAVSKGDEFEKSVAGSSDELKKISRYLESARSRMNRFSGKLDELLERKQVLIDSLSQAKENEEQIARERCMSEIVSELEMQFGSQNLILADCGN